MEFHDKEYVLAKIKGFPDWPAVVIPEIYIPENIKNIKPQQQADNLDYCVRFFFDDQYSWLNSSNLSKLSDKMVNDYLISVNELDDPDKSNQSINDTDNNNKPVDKSKKKKAGRKKRITEAYLKLKNVPIDEFIQYGSWGIPEQKNDDDNNNNNDDNIDELKLSRSSRKSRNKKTSVDQDNLIITKKGKKNTTVSKKRGKPGRPKKNLIPSPDIEDIIVNDYNEHAGDDDYVSDDVEDDDVDLMDDLEDEDDENIEQSDDLDVDNDDGEEDEEIEEDHKHKSKKQKTKDSVDIEIEIDEEDENDENDWNLAKENDIDINFNEIPSALDLANEVSSMNEWCKNLRYELQSLILPLPKQKLGELSEEDQKKLNDENEKNPVQVQVQGSEQNVKTETDTNDNENIDNDDNQIKKAKQNGNSDIQKIKEEVQPLPDYKKINKTIDKIITPLLEADISKSILKSTGLMKIVSIILRKPEFQTPTIKKLNKWWTTIFDYSISVDDRWGDDFTFAMYLEEEKQRKEREEEKKRKRREERKLQLQSQSQTTTPDI